jgi:hypothetical protein
LTIVTRPSYGVGIVVRRAMLWNATGTWRAIRQLSRPRRSHGRISAVAAFLADLSAVLSRRHQSMRRRRAWS